MDAIPPLPKVDRADELKRRSMALVGAAVPHRLFIWRDEPQNDKGVDFTIEAIVSGRATRCKRSHPGGFVLTRATAAVHPRA